MESKMLPSVFLEDFLDVLPKSALVLKSHSQLSSGDSLKVSYANRAFLDIIGDDFGGMDAETFDLTSLLQAKCVHPAMSRFIKWIDSVLQNPTAGHSLRTSFEGNEVAEKGASSHRRIVDIEWEAVVLQTYIVLTGKTTGTAAYFREKALVTRHSPRPSLHRLPSNTSMSSQSGTSEVTSDIGIPTIKAISPCSSDKLRRAAD